MESRRHYLLINRVFHWVIAFAVFIMLSVGFMLDSLPKHLQGTAYMLHKSTGITILFLMCVRFVVLKITGRPKLPRHVTLWERLLSRFVQYGFYVLLILMPLSGWVMSVADGRIPQYFGMFPFTLPTIEPNKALAEFMFHAHNTIAWILIVFISLHVLGALKHYFIDKDDVLDSILLGKK